jgi:hypothetical protein
MQHDWLRVRGGAAAACREARREPEAALQNRTQAPAPWLIASSRIRHRPIAPIFAPQGTRDAHGAHRLPLILESGTPPQANDDRSERDEGERCCSMREAH